MMFWVQELAMLGFNSYTLKGRNHLLGGSTVAPTLGVSVKRTGKETDKVGRVKLTDDDHSG
jgi:hypothetical protein